MNKDMKKYVELIPSLKILESAEKINETQEMIFFTKKRKILVSAISAGFLIVGSIKSIMNYVDYFINVRPLVSSIHEHATVLADFIDENPNDVFDISANRIDNKSIGQDYLEQNSKIVEDCENALITKDFKAENYCEYYKPKKFGDNPNSYYSYDSCLKDAKKQNIVTDKKFYANQCIQQIDSLLIRAQTSAVELKDYKKNKIIADQASVSLSAMYDDFIKFVAQKKQAGEISGSEAFELEQKYGNDGYVRKTDKNMLNRMTISAHASTFESQVQKFLSDKKNTFEKLRDNLSEKPITQQRTAFVQKMLSQTPVPIPVSSTTKQQEFGEVVKKEQKQINLNIEKQNINFDLKKSQENLRNQITVSFKKVQADYKIDVDLLNELLSDKSILHEKRKKAAAMIIEPTVGNLSGLRCIDKQSCENSENVMNTAIQQLQKTRESIASAIAYLKTK